MPNSEARDTSAAAAAIGIAADLLPAAEQVAEVVLPTAVPDVFAFPAEMEAKLAIWVGQTIHNSPISENTRVYNYFMSTALPALRLALMKG